MGARPKRLVHSKQEGARMSRVREEVVTALALGTASAVLLITVTLILR